MVSAARGNRRALAHGCVVGGCMDTDLQSLCGMHVVVLHSATSPAMPLPTHRSGPRMCPPATCRAP